MRAIGKFYRLSNREKLLTALAATALIEVQIELKLVGFRHRRWLEQPSPSLDRNCPARRRAGAISAEQIAWAVKAASARIPGATNCLVRALALKYLLTIFGHDATLRIGAGHRDVREFEAHAWVESAGRILIGEFNDGLYEPFPSPQSHPPGNPG